MSTKVLLSILVLVSLLASCNMPAGQSPVTPPPGNERVSLDENAMATAVALTAAARLTEIAGSVTATPTATPVPTQCTPSVTPTVNANVRSGPGTAYDIVGALMLGQSATLAGRNDANTWWYIVYPSTGSYAWIAGSVVTASCVPAVVLIVAAPPLPTTGPVVEDSPTDDTNNDSDSSDAVSDTGGSPALPDLVPGGMQVTPGSGGGVGHPVNVQVRVRNRGEAAAGSFTVEWRPVLSAVGCTWTVNSLGPGASKSLSCTYTYVKSCVGACSIVLVVDPLNEVTEANEDNNHQQDSYDQTP